jgi:hypothetical protein
MHYLTAFYIQILSVPRLCLFQCSELKAFSSHSWIKGGNLLSLFPSLTRVCVYMLVFGCVFARAHMCVCVRERERGREGGRGGERERERESPGSGPTGPLRRCSGRPPADGPRRHARRRRPPRSRLLRRPRRGPRALLIREPHGAGSLGCAIAECTHIEACVARLRRGVPGDSPRRRQWLG